MNLPLGNGRYENDQQPPAPCRSDGDTSGNGQADQKTGEPSLSMRTRFRWFGHEFSVSRILSPSLFLAMSKKSGFQKISPSPDVHDGPELFGAHFQMVAVLLERSHLFARAAEPALSSLEFAQGLDEVGLTEIGPQYFGKI